MEEVLSRSLHGPVCAVAAQGRVVESSYYFGAISFDVSDWTYAFAGSD